MLEHSNDGVPVVLGGDPTVVLPELRAQVAYRKQPMAMVHFSSHSDTGHEYWGERYTLGTMLRLAVEDGLVDTAHSIHVGLHGSTYDDTDWAHSRTFGFTTLTLRESLAMGTPAMIERISEQAGDGPVYPSFDIEVLDSAFAAGTGTPEVGGYTTAVR